MRKILLGLVAAAAIASPLALATSAQAEPTLNPDADCAPILPADAIDEVNHVEYKYVRVVGTGQVQWSTKSEPTMTFGTVAYKAEYDIKGVHKTKVVIDSAAVPAVDGVTCVIPIPAFPSDLLSLTRPADTEKYTWSPVLDHVALNGKIAVAATANPGYVFAYNGGTTTIKQYTLTGVSQFSYDDAFFGPVKCNETTSATSDKVACTFTGTALRPANEADSLVGMWNSDFGGRANLGDLAYRVNADATGYTGTVTYPNG